MTLFFSKCVKTKATTNYSKSVKDIDNCSTITMTERHVKNMVSYNMTLQVVHCLAFLKLIALIVNFLFLSGKFFAFTLDYLFV